MIIFYFCFTFGFNFPTRVTENSQLTCYVRSHCVCFLQVNGFRSYVDLYVKDKLDETGVALKVVNEAVNDRWEVCLTMSEKGFQQISFVNSIATTKVAGTPELSSTTTVMFYKPLYLTHLTKTLYNDTYEVDHLENIFISGPYQCSGSY